LSGGAIAAAIAQQVATASVPRLLIHSTVNIATLAAAGEAAVAVSANVAALTEGVLKTMLLGKLKTTSALILAIAIVAAGASTVEFGPTANAQDKPVDTGFTPGARPDPPAQFVPKGTGTSDSQPRGKSKPATRGFREGTPADVLDPATQ